MAIYSLTVSLRVIEIDDPDYTKVSEILVSPKGEYTGVRPENAIACYCSYEGGNALVSFYAPY